MSIGELRPLLGAFMVNPRREEQTRRSRHWHSAYMTSPSEPASRQIEVKWLKTQSVLEIDLRDFVLSDMPHCNPTHSPHTAVMEKVQTVLLLFSQAPCFTTIK